MAKSEVRGAKRGNAKKEKEEAEAEAAYVMQPIDHHRWVSGLRKFERFRMSHGYSVKDLFNTLNTRGTQRMTKNQFVETITEFLPSVRDYEALALARQIARQKRCHGFVTAHGIEVVLDSVEDLSSVRALLIDHPIFPSWLTERSDFQSLFEEWNSDNGCPSIYLIERTCASAPEKRRPADLTVLIKWLKIYNVLQQVRASRLLDCARKLNLMHVPANMAVVTQGEPGDAFYVVLTGTLDVQVGTTNVNTMVSGTAFGEKALENDAPRSATVVAAEPCKLLVLLASDYKSLATHAQLRMNKDLAAFLMAECSAFKQFSISRVLNIVKLVVRKKFSKGDQVLIQNEGANGLCILLKGRVRLRRTISVKTLIEKKFIKRRDSFMFMGDGLPGASRGASRRASQAGLDLSAFAQAGGQGPDYDQDRDQDQDRDEDHEDKQPAIRSAPLCLSQVISAAACQSISPASPVLRRFSSTGAIPSRRDSSAAVFEASYPVTGAVPSGYEVYGGLLNSVSESVHGSDSGPLKRSASIVLGAQREPTSNTVLVGLGDLTPGALYGDDCLRLRSFNSYAGMAVEPVEVLVINVKEALEFFRGDVMKSILKETAYLHRTDLQLVTEHEQEVRRQLVLKRVRTAALPQIYRNKLGEHSDQSPGPSYKGSVASFTPTDPDRKPFS